MKISSFLTKAIILASMLHTTAAIAVIDNNAGVVKLRDPANSGCIEAGVNLHNCFTDLNTLSSWVTNIRKPNATKPLHIDIGPGKFAGQFLCNNTNYPGYVTLQGSGMKNTVIEAASNPVSTTYCTQMRFSHMTLRNTGNLFGVNNLGGSTFWDNIEIDGFGYAWYDSPTTCGGTPGKHYWFNSRITSKTAANSSTAYYNACDESWFFGSEITANATVSGGSIRTLAAVGGEVHVYGSVIRALSGAGITTTSTTAVLASSNSNTHIHGTGIDVISAAGNNVTALSASTGGNIHANSSAYNMTTGSGGTVARISNNGGHVHAPYLWEHVPDTDGNASTINTNFSTANGADQTTVTAGTSDGQPHLAVYSATCP
jgi:hypothetical protein